ncbi:MAG TPA: YdeI/OmpD-associated family protein [Thermoanaerobaculia bacterium]|nr:YdeI/OmpD-associated family protein [Thermoanaerobaculia bacterium]
MKNRSPEVDQYIESAAPFAKPILERLRTAFHKAHPDVFETIKWRVPHFEYKGILGGMAAFKAYVTWGFWKPDLMNDPNGILQASSRAMGGMKVTDASQLPSETILIAYVREAIRLNEEGITRERPKRAPSPEPAMPAELTAALKKTPAAKQTFDAFSPSHRREYIEWIAEAKQTATKEKRVAQTIEWLVEGKPRNWKYMKK